MLLNSGFILPVAHRPDWVRAYSAGREWFVCVKNTRGEAVAGFSVAGEPSRALPGHLILYAERVSACANFDATKVALKALTAASRLYPWLLRLEVALFDRDPGRRAALSEVLRDLGFRDSRAARSYAETLAVDLTGGVEALFATLHPTARRHIRAVNNRPVAVRCIHDQTLGPRLHDLLRQTMRRTRGRFRSHPWSDIIAFAVRHPSLVRPVGLFDTRKDGPASLVAFALGLSQGDHVQYSVAASTRTTDLRMPLGYALMWDLITWASERGAAWFDMGGVSAGCHGDLDDPTGGISDFKRYFSRRSVRVGEEWALEPRPILAAGTRAVSSVVTFVRRSQHTLRRRVLVSKAQAKPWTKVAK